MTLLLELLSWACLLGGGFFCITGGLGLLRLPDFYSRSHGGGVLDSLGVALILLGLAFQAPNYLVAIKLALIFVFLLLTGPTAIHALARAALFAGLKPHLATHSSAHNEKVAATPEAEKGEPSSNS
jgi:multicomponent Na+:H+ antiporter subunit G